MVEKNPFNWRRVPGNLIGQDRLLEKLKENMLKGSNWIFIYGQVGSGKTAIGKRLKKILEKEKGIVPVWISADELKGVKNISLVKEYFEPQIQKFYTMPIISMILKPPKRPREKDVGILFVDEFHALSLDHWHQIKSAYDQELFDSLVIMQIDNKITNAPKTLKHRISLYATPTPLNEHQLKEMIKERKDIFEDNVINHIIGKVGKNPRNVLIACSNLNAWVKKEGKITLDDVKPFTNLLEKEIPSEEIEPEESTEEVVIDKKEKINWAGLEKRPSPTHKEILEYMFNKDGSVTVKEIAKKLERKEKNIAIHLSKLENIKLIKKVSKSRPVKYILSSKTEHALTTD